VLIRGGILVSLDQLKLTISSMARSRSVLGALGIVSRNVVGAARRAVGYGARTARGIGRAVSTARSLYRASQPYMRAIDSYAARIKSKFSSSRSRSRSKHTAPYKPTLTKKRTRAFPYKLLKKYRKR
jgi:hypothetical protein